MFCTNYFLSSQANLGGFIVHCLCYNAIMIKAKTRTPLVYKSIKNKKILKIIIILLLAVACLATSIFIIFCYNNKKPVDTKVDKNNSAPVALSKVEEFTKTKEVAVKEWGIKMPVYSKYLGDVSYSITDSTSGKYTSTLVFSSSILNGIDLSAPECSGITSNSWGIIRTKKEDDVKSSNPSISNYVHNGEYSMQFMRPQNLCSMVLKVQESFYNMYSKMDNI